MIKRLFDFFVSLIGLILLSLVLVVIAISIKLGSKGPVLFRQKRVGKEGKVFILVKFRSMMVNQNSNNTITSKGDDRITKIGAFLRRYKLDELPELWNVLKGEMSLVGPRPDVSGYADKLKGKDRKI